MVSSRTTTFLIGFGLVVGVVIAFVVIVAIATPGGPPEIAPIEAAVNGGEEEPEGYYQNATVSVSASNVTNNATGNVTTTTTNETGAIGTAEDTGTETQGVIEDLFGDWTAEALTDAIVGFMTDTMGFFMGDTGNVLGIFSDIWEQFSDPGGGYHG